MSVTSPVRRSRRRRSPRTLALLVALVALVAPLVVAGSSPTAATAVRTRPVRLTAEVLDALTIPEIQDLMDEGRLSSVALTLAYLHRIRTVDDDVNAVLTVNVLAIAEAAASDLHRRRRGPRSALEGVPVLLKDNIDTRSRLLPTTAGSRALLRSRPADDAALVQRLRDAGAVVIGKANLSEWANFRGDGATSGWSAVGGLTNNPYVLDRNACGSSSGSAAGVAASLAQVAIGTETNGSIVCPAGATGVVGFKPTLGLVSRGGVVPISAEQDTAGPIARHVVDAALTLAVIQGPDPYDPATGAIPVDQPASYELDAGALDGARIGVWRKETDSPETDAVTERAVAALQAAGAETVDVDLDPLDRGHLETIDLNAFPALLAEFKRDINAYLAATPGRHPADLAGLIEFNRDDPFELRYFGQEVFEAAQAAPSTDDPTYLAQRAAATGAARSSIDETLAAYGLDAIMAPTNSPAWVSTLGAGDAFLFGTSGPAAVAGYPNVTVPAGYVGPLPVGMSFFSTAWADADVLDVAYAFERSTSVRMVPQLIPTIGP
jgi:amidase